MKKIIQNLITTLIVILMIIIFLLTVYFCLDVFGIINVPKKYSIANIFYSRIELIAQGVNTEEVLPVKDIKKDRIIIDSEDDETEEVSSNAKNPLELLDQNDYSNNNNNNNNNSEKNNIDSHRFYYNQLDEYGKILYDGLYAHLEDLKTGEYTIDFGLEFNDLLQTESGEQILKNSLDSSINSLILDNPEIFYIDISKMYLLTNITTKIFSTTYNVSVGGHGENYLDDNLHSKEEVDKAINDVNSVRNQILNKARNLNKIEQIKFVHDYLVDNVEYDLNNGSTVYNIYGTFINKRVVCEGYAKAFKNLLDELDIPCIIVCGTGTNSAGLTESHAWNYVLIEDKWYAIDVTWDDPIVNGFLLGGLPDDVRYGHFLKGSREFFNNHVEDEYLLGNLKLNYPKICEEDY